MERDTPLVPVENGLIEAAGNSQDTQQLHPEVDNSSQLEEFAKPGVVETEDDRRKRQRRNQRRISEQEKRLLEIYHYLHQQVQVGKKIRHTVLFVHLRWSR